MLNQPPSVIPYFFILSRVCLQLIALTLEVMLGKTKLSHILYYYYTITPSRVAFELIKKISLCLC